MDAWEVGSEEKGEGGNLRRRSRMEEQRKGSEEWRK